MKSLILAIITITLISCNASGTTTNQDTSASPFYSYDIEARLDSLGMTLPEVKLPKGASIELYTRSGNMIYLSGKGPGNPDGTNITGKVGAQLSVEEGNAAARLVATHQIARLKHALGDLNKVKRVVKVLGMVNADPSFTQHPQVINGYSDLMIDVFGDRGRHARSAVGMSSLPGDIAVEIEMIVEVE